MTTPAAPRLQYHESALGLGRLSIAGFDLGEADPKVRRYAAGFETVLRNRRGQFDRRRLCGYVRLYALNWLLEREWRKGPAGQLHVIRACGAVCSAFGSPSAQGKSEAIAVLEKELRRRRRTEQRAGRSGIRAYWKVRLDLACRLAIAVFRIRLTSRRHPWFRSTMEMAMEGRGYFSTEIGNSFLDREVSRLEDLRRRGKLGGRGMAHGVPRSNPKRAAVEWALQDNPVEWDANEIARKVLKVWGIRVDPRTVRRWVGVRPAP